MSLNANPLRRTSLVLKLIVQGLELHDRSWGVRKLCRRIGRLDAG